MDAETADTVRFLLGGIAIALALGAGRGHLSTRDWLPHRSTRELMGLPPKERRMPKGCWVQRNGVELKTLDEPPPSRWTKFVCWLLYGWRWRVK
jgi:hypothetical protein